MRSSALSGAVGLAVFSASAFASAGGGLTTGSQYVEMDLGSSDGLLAIVWDGNRLLGAGTVDSYTYFSRSLAPIRPLIVKRTGQFTLDVVAVGQTHTPGAIGTQFNVPFVPVSGSAAYDAAGGGGAYYFAFSSDTTHALGVAYNNNPIDTQEGFLVSYGQPVSTTGAVSMNTLPASQSRHYEMAVHTVQTGVQEAVGLELANRTYVDGAGYTFVRTDVGFTHAGRVTKWSGFADVAGAQTLTPLIVRNVGTAEEPILQIRGVGTAREFTTRDFFVADFGLASGTDMVQPGDLIGWWDSGNGGGVVPYNLNFLSPQSTPTASVRYFGTGAATLTAGNTLGAGSLDSRSYSITFETASACAVDFDQSGTVTVQDIFAFLNAWFAGDPRADFDGASGLQVADIFAFLNAWFAGC